MDPTIPHSYYLVISDIHVIWSHPWTVLFRSFIRQFDEVKLRLGSERLLIVAVQVVSIANAKNVTISLVEADAILLPRVGSFPAF